MFSSLFLINDSEQNLNSPPDKLWNGVKFSVLSLPLFPTLGSIAFVITLIWTGKRYYQQILSSRLTKGFAIFTLWLIITTIFAVKPVFALEGTANFIPYMAFFLAFRCLFQTFSQLEQLAWCFVLSSLPVTVLGLLQLLGWDSGSFLQVLGTHIVALGNPEGRMSSSFMYANLLAAFLLTPFVLSLGLCIINYQVFQQKKQLFINAKMIILGLTILLNSVSLILTNSRNAWGLLFLIIVAFSLYLGWRWLVWGLGGMAVSVMWAAWGTIGKETLRKVIPAYFWARLSDELYPDRVESALRTTQWGIAWEMWQQRPLLGWGLRNFSPYYKLQMKTWLGHPHNFYLMLLAEIGIIGTVLFCSLIGWIYGQSVYYYICLEKSSQERTPEKTLLFSYLLVFLCCILFNLLDVTVFDLRVNVTNWLILCALSGVVFHQQKEQKI